MRIAILADIHANLTAFTAVLRDCVERGGVDEYWFLGDMVNYGPEPEKCIKLAQRALPPSQQPAPPCPGSRTHNIYRAGN
jgi:hypothetical protein